jgi:hypothetical protein
MTVKGIYPTSVPSLDLNFGKLKRLDPRITFTRASIGTFVGSNGLIQTAASGAARFDHNPATGESLGLLVEEARTNELTQSQTFSTWTLSNASITTNVTTSPDGTNNASKLIENSATGSRSVSQSINPSGNYTLSVFAKAAERNILTVIPASTGGGGTPVYFDLSNGTISTSLGSATSAFIQGYPNGWYRCSVTDTMGGFGYPFIGVAAVSGTQSYTGNGTSGIYIWGAQLEAGTFPTSYIPTSGSIVTRAADVATIQGSNWLNIWNTGGAGNSIYAEANIAYTTTAPFPGGPVMYAMDGDTGGGTSKLWYSYLEASRGPVDGTGGGGGAVELFHGGVTSRGPGTFKSCMTFDVPNNRLQSSWNTVLATAAASAAYYNNMWALGASPRLTIGGKDLGSNRHAWCGCIKRMAIYSIGLPDAQLQALTQ